MMLLSSLLMPPLLDTYATLPARYNRLRITFSSTPPVFPTFCKERERERKKES